MVHSQVFSTQAKADKMVHFCNLNGQHQGGGNRECLDFIFSNSLGELMNLGEIMSKRNKGKKEGIKKIKSF